MTSEAAAQQTENEVSRTGRSPETVDRILVGVCGAIWLALLAVSASATVALFRLASGHSSGGERHSSWLLYSVIAVSALIIVGAIPLLLRARRNARADHGDSVVQNSAAARVPVTPVDAPTAKIRVFGVDPSAPQLAEAAPAAPLVPAAVLDRLWLRGTVSLLSALGLALTAVAAASYLLAVASDSGAWVALGLAGVITIAMPAVLIFHQRMMIDVVEEAGE
jgi:hypothetical protein